jgi:hypothetical protein
MTVPWNNDDTPSVTWPPTAQNTLLACAPPISTTCIPVAMSSVCAIWNIQTPLLPPFKIKSVGIVTVELHLYRPGASVMPLRMPPPSSVKSGFARLAAFTYAACMSLTAVVNIVGVGAE